MATLVSHISTALVGQNFVSIQDDVVPEPIEITAVAASHDYDGNNTIAITVNGDVVYKVDIDKDVVTAAP